MQMRWLSILLVSTSCIAAQTLQIPQGGTGCNTAACALANLGGIPIDWYAPYPTANMYAAQDPASGNYFAGAYNFYGYVPGAPPILGDTIYAIGNEGYIANDGTVTDSDYFIRSEHSYLFQADHLGNVGIGGVGMGGGGDVQNGDLYMEASVGAFEKYMLSAPVINAGKSNGVMHPDACLGAIPPTWCPSGAGVTADMQIKAACAQLTTGTDSGSIVGGGTVDLRGYGASVQILDNSVYAGCMSHEKPVTFLVDPATMWLVGQTDGGCPFPIDEGSSVQAPGVGANNNGTLPYAPYGHFDTGFMLLSTANVDAIFCPAYPLYDTRPQETMSISGVAVLGAPGAQVTHGLIDMSNVYGNSSVENVTALQCNEACVYSENSNAVRIINPDFSAADTGDSTVDGTPIVFYANSIPSPTGGVLVGDAHIQNGQIIHGNGGERITILSNPVANEVWIVNGTSITWKASGASGNQVNIGANPTATAIAFCAIGAWATDPNLVNSTCTNLAAYPGMIRLLPVVSTYEQSFSSTRHTETPSGAVPGTVYTLTSEPPSEYALATATTSATGTLLLTVNGHPQLPITGYAPAGAYTLSGSTITFAAPTTSGDVIVASWATVKVKTYYAQMQVDNDGLGGWAMGIDAKDTYFERAGGIAINPAIGVLFNDCWNCNLTNIITRGGANQGQDAVKVTGTGNLVKSNHFNNVAVWGGLSGDGWVNALTDLVTPQIIPVDPASNETTLDQIIVMPDQWQMNIPPNTALVGLGADVMAGAGLFSGTGTTYTGWSTHNDASLTGHVTYALSTADPPPGSTQSTPSSQVVTIGANTALAAAGAGVQTAAIYAVTAGTPYYGSVQAHIVSGSINLITVYIGSTLGVNNCEEGQPVFLLTSPWATYHFKCTAKYTENVLVLVEAAMQPTGALTGAVAFGNMQFPTYLGLVTNDLTVGQNGNTVGPFIGTAYCWLYQSAAEATACLAGNTTTTPKVPVQTGDGAGHSAAPVMTAASTTVNGQPCALGSTCTVTAAAASIAVGTTTVSGGTAGNLLVNGVTLSDVAAAPAAVGLSAVTNDAQTKAAIVPNTAPAAGKILVGNAGGTAYAPVTMSGNCTLDSTGAITCGSRPLYLAGLQSATTTNTNPVTLTGSTYSLLANTLAASGCVDILFAAIHSTGTTTSTVTLNVGSANIAWSATTSVGTIGIRATYCNTTGTGAGGQFITSDATYMATVGSKSPVFNNVSQASTGALAISVTVADATNTDAWTLDMMRVELHQ